MSDMVRVVRVLIYEGPRERVEQAIAKSIHGTRDFGKLRIHEVEIGKLEIPEEEPDEPDDPGPNYSMNND